MLSIKMYARVTKEPLIRTPAALQSDMHGALTAPVPTDRLGIARLDLASGTRNAHSYAAVSTHRERAGVAR
jgi:hypothetical protein